MSIIQNLLVKFLSAETKRGIALTETLTPKEALAKASSALLAEHAPVNPKALTQLAYSVSESNGGKLVGNNQLAADKAARTYLTGAFGEIDRVELNALIAIQRAQDAQ